MNLDRRGSFMSQHLPIRPCISSTGVMAWQAAERTVCTAVFPGAENSGLTGEGLG
jgi:hypothetical protein